MSKSAPIRKNGIESFIPTSGDLVIRDIIANGPDMQAENSRKSGHLRRPATMGGYRFGQLSMSSFFTRHNPHSKRVNHFKGLLDVPICTVNDFDSAKRAYSLEFPPNNYTKQVLQNQLPTECINVNSQQYPMDTLTGLHYFHPLKNLPFGQRPATGVVPVSEPWREELQQIAKAAGLSTAAEERPKEERKRTSQYSAATGRLIPPPTKGISRASSRARTAQFLNQVNTGGDMLNPSNMEDSVMMMLCQILQTDDVDAVQTWLGNAGENEKGMVQELIKAAMTGKAEGHNSQYPVQEYMIGLDGLPMTPDIGTVIGDHVQNRLSTADDEPAVPEPSMRPPSAPGDKVEEVVARIEQFSPRISARQSLPPIAETNVQESKTVPDVLEVKHSSPVQPTQTPKPLPSIPPKQQSFNKALENITRRTLDSLSEHKTDPNLKKFTKYPLSKDDSITFPTKPTSAETRLKLTSSSSKRPLVENIENQPTKLTSAKAAVWKPEEAMVI